MARSHTMIVAFLLLASCAPRQDGAQLMAALRAASGGDALNALSGFHEKGTVAAGGHTGTYETWGDFRSLRWSNVHERGGVTEASGYDGHVAWNRGGDGVVHTDISPKALAAARLGAYLTNAAYLFPERFAASFEYQGRRDADGTTYDVVTVTPADSNPVDFWLDLKTHRLARLSGMDGETPFQGVVERYEVIAGVYVPFVMRQSQGGREMIQTLTLYEFVNPPEEHLTQP